MAVKSGIPAAIFVLDAFSAAGVGAAAVQVTSTGFLISHQASISPAPASKRWRRRSTGYSAISCND